MGQYAIPVVLGLAIWWSSTCLIFYLDGLPRRTFPLSMAGATALLLAALYELKVSASQTTSGGAYSAFTAAVLIWAWLEVSFYMGYITGPRRHHCHEGCSGWAHFGHAIQVSLYHEIAVLVMAALVSYLTWGAPNQFGTWTFVILSWMHQSARLNVFLGVSNLNADFLPPHLSHLRSFFRNAPMNMLFPFSVTASTICAALMGVQTLAASGNRFNTTGYALLTTMMALAILEHWFLVLPPPVTKVWNGLWQWSMSFRAETTQTDLPRQGPLPTQATIGGRQ
jgi:putative photosynthetic complex assembly protein 2